MNHCRYLQFLKICLFLSGFVFDRELKTSSFVSDLKAGKTHALEVLNKIPHIIPHRKVSYSILADTLIWQGPKLMHLILIRIGKLAPKLFTGKY